MLRRTIYSFAFLSILFFVPYKANSQELLTLGKALEIGLNNNFDIQIANKNNQIAEINNCWGNAGRYPTINFLASGSVSSVYQPGDDITSYSVNSSVMMDWVLFDGFRVNITKEKLQDLKSLSDGQEIVVIELVIRKIISAWYLARITQEKAIVQKEMMELSKDRYDQAKKLVELGSSTQYELLQAQNAWLEDKGNYLNQRVDARNAKRNLCYVMGEDVGKSSWKISGELNARNNDFVMTDLIDKMMRDNSNLRNQYLSQKLKVDELKLSKSKMFPSLSLSAGATGKYNETDPSSLMTPTGYNTTPSVSLKLSYNLFNGGNRRRAIQVAQINREISDLKVDDMKISLSNQLSQYYDMYEVNKELLSLSKQQVKASKLNLDISKQKLRSGAINSFNFRDVQVLYLNAVTSNLNALYKLQLSYVDLVTITGGIIAEYSSK